LVPILQGANAPPTTPVATAVTERRQGLATLPGRWKVLSTTELAALNGELAKAGLPAIVVK